MRYLKNFRRSQSVFLLAVAAAVVALTACTPGAQEMTFPVLPAELRDCRFYHLTDGGGSTIRVVRCPNSSTSTSYQESSGKSQVTRTTVVLDGVSYSRDAASEPGPSGRSNN